MFDYVSNSTESTAILPVYFVHIIVQNIFVYRSLSVFDVPTFWIIFAM
jgi:hypothetical protein